MQDLDDKGKSTKVTYTLECKGKVGGLRVIMYLCVCDCVCEGGGATVCNCVTVCVCVCLVGRSG